MVTSHVIKPLTPETFPAWKALAAKHNGVWGGCWCSYFHGDTADTEKREHDGPTFKERLIGEGVAHAALVFDGDDAPPDTRPATARGATSVTAPTTAVAAAQARAAPVLVIDVDPAAAHRRR